MTQKELFTKALKREPIVGHVPHFELVFFLTMEAVGRIHPCHRNYSQWYQMSRAERKLHLKDMALSYIEVAQKYNHSAIFVHPNPSPIGELPNDIEATREILETIRDLSGDEYFLMIHGDPTYPIPTGDTMMEFSAQLYDEPELIHEGTKKRLDFSMKLCDEMACWMAGHFVRIIASTSILSIPEKCLPNSFSPTWRRSLLITTKTAFIP
ncbi:MAG: hypothetical protein RR975_13965 [Clostridia bacterium]